MKLRPLVAAAGLGAAAFANRTLSRAGGALSQALPGDQETYRWRGMDVAYATLGDPDDPPVVLFHDPGVVGTSREFVSIAESLAEDYRVLAPDFPGYGLSDRPPLQYSASLYEAFVGDFATEVPETAPAVVASGLAGSYAVLAADEAEIDRLALLCPTTSSAERSVARRTAVRAPILGTAAYNAMTSGKALESWIGRQLFYGPPSPDYVEYLWTSAHQAGARYAPASALGGHLDPEIELPDAIADVDASVTLVWGREAREPPLRDGRTIAEQTESRLVVVDFARRLPHLEHPDETLVALDEAFSTTSA